MLKPKKAWLALTLFALTLTLLTFLLNLLAPGIIHQGAYFILLFFFLLTLLTHYLSVAALREGHDKFALVFFGSITVRLLISVAVVLVVLLKGIPHKITFVVNFAVTYLAFLIFEIYALLTTLRSNFQKRAENAEKRYEKPT